MPENNATQPENLEMPLFNAARSRAPICPAIGTKPHGRHFYRLPKYDVLPHIPNVWLGWIVEEVR